MELVTINWVDEYIFVFTKATTIDVHTHIFEHIYPPAKTPLMIIKR